LLFLFNLSNFANSFAFASNVESYVFDEVLTLIPLHTNAYLTNLTTLLDFPNSNLGHLLIVDGPQVPVAEALGIPSSFCNA